MQPANKLKKHNLIPIYIVEDHDEALPHIYRNIGSKHLPVSNNFIIHFDSHPDLSIPRSMPATKAKDKYEMFNAISIENWIIPSCFAGYINHIAWIKPMWSNQIPEGKYNFDVGEDESGHIAVNCPLDYYISEGVYSKSLKNAQSIELDVLKDDASDLINVMDLPFILDIDLDYFSTYNPFQLMFSKGDVYEKLKHIFVYQKPDIKSEEQIAESVNCRNALLDELEQYFNHLEQYRNLDNWSGPTTTNYNKVYDLGKYVLDFYDDQEIDWTIVFNAGCTWDDPEYVLPHHESTEDELNIMYDKFDKFLSSLSASPTLITIARSSQDNYCPPHQVEDIQTNVLNILEKRFQVDINFDYVTCDD